MMSFSIPLCNKPPQIQWLTTTMCYSPNSELAWAIPPLSVVWMKPLRRLNQLGVWPPSRSLSSLNCPAQASFQQSTLLPRWKIPRGQAHQPSTWVMFANELLATASHMAEIRVNLQITSLLIWYCHKLGSLKIDSKTEINIQEICRENYWDQGKRGKKAEFGEGRVVLNKAKQSTQLIHQGTLKLEWPWSWERMRRPGPCTPALTFTGCRLLQ